MFQETEPSFISGNGAFLYFRKSMFRTQAYLELQKEKQLILKTFLIFWEKKLFSPEPKRHFIFKERNPAQSSLL